MNKNIVLAGVGGQGILTISAIIDLSAMHKGLKVKQAEVHGMSQRGGAVQSHLRISDNEIYSDLIPVGSADLILSTEPMEALRYLPFLSPDGLVVTATESFRNISNYPDENTLRNQFKGKIKSILIEADRLAKEAGSQKTFNVVMLGAASPFIGIEKSELEWGIRMLFSEKGEAVTNMNIKAFRIGLENTLKLIN